MESQASPTSRARNSSSTSHWKTLAQDMVAKAVNAPKRGRGRPKRAPGQPVHRRPCEQISYSDASNVVKAIHFAHEIGMPLTAHVTIQWRYVESDLSVADRQARLLNKMGLWLRRQAKVPPVWVYARETGSKKGEHLHLLVHVPGRNLPAFERQMKAWVEADVSRLGEIRERPVVTKTIKPGHERTRLKSYLLKEGEPAVHDIGWVTADHRRKATGGVILGKRVKVSHAIGPKARAEHATRAK